MPIYSPLRIHFVSLAGSTGKVSPRMTGGEASDLFTLPDCAMNLSVSFSLFPALPFISLLRRLVTAVS